MSTTSCSRKSVCSFRVNQLKNLLWFRVPYRHQEHVSHTAGPTTHDTRQHIDHLKNSLKANFKRAIRKTRLVQFIVMVVNRFRSPWPNGTSYNATQSRAEEATTGRDVFFFFYSQLLRLRSFSASLPSCGGCRGLHKKHPPYVNPQLATRIGKRELGFNLMNQDDVKMDKRCPFHAATMWNSSLVDTCKIISAHKSLALIIVYVLTVGVRRSSGLTSAVVSHRASVFDD